MIRWYAYDRSYASPGWFENLTDRLAEPAVFSTAIPGGFKQAAVYLRAMPEEAWRWYEERIFYRLCGYSLAGRLLFEGRIEEARLSPVGVVLTAYGFYRNLSDRTYTRLWSNKQFGSWLKPGTAYNAYHKQDKFETDNADKVYIAAKNGAHFEINEFGYLKILVPDDAADNIARVLFTYAFSCPDSNAGAWKFGLYNPGSLAYEWSTDDTAAATAVDQVLAAPAAELWFKLEALEQKTTAPDAPVVMFYKSSAYHVLGEYKGDSGAITRVWNYDGANYVDEDTFRDISLGGHDATSILYVGSDAPFNVVDISMDTSSQALNTNSVTLDVKFWDGDSWETVAGIHDDTISSSKSYAKSGKITFMLPDGWAKTTVNSEGVSKYYVQIIPSGALSASVVIRSMHVHTWPGFWLTGWASSADEVLYVGADGWFDKLEIKLAKESKNAQTTASIFTAYISAGSSSWTAITIADTTIITGVTLKQDGTITFDLPAPGTAWNRDTINGLSKFWVKIRLSVGSASLDGRVGITEIKPSLGKTMVYATVSAVRVMTAVNDTVYADEVLTDAMIDRCSQVVQDLLVVATGTHTGSGNSKTTLIDSAGAFTTETRPGDLVYNDTDGSSGVVGEVSSATTIRVTGLAGGSDNDFDTNDEYTIKRPFPLLLQAATPADINNLVIEDEYLAERIAWLGDRADGACTPERYEFAIWEGRRPVFKAKTTAVAWRVAAHQVQVDIGRAGDGLWNEVFHVYRDEEGLIKRGTLYTDADSIARYGLTRTRAVEDLEFASDQESAAQLLLSIRSDPKIDARVVMGPMIYHANGTLRPVSEVRAGERIQVYNLAPAAIMRRAVDAIWEFEAVETEYDDGTGLLSVVPDESVSGLLVMPGWNVAPGRPSRPGRGNPPVGGDRTIWPGWSDNPANGSRAYYP